MFDFIYNKIVDNIGYVKKSFSIKDLNKLISSKDINNEYDGMHEWIINKLDSYTVNNKISFLLNNIKNSTIQIIHINDDTDDYCRTFIIDQKIIDRLFNKKYKMIIIDIIYNE